MEEYHIINWSSKMYDTGLSWNKALDLAVKGYGGMCAIVWWDTTLRGWRYIDIKECLSIKDV